MDSPKPKTEPVHLAPGACHKMTEACWDIVDLCDAAAILIDALGPKATDVQVQTFKALGGILRSAQRAAHSINDLILEEVT